MLYKKTIINVLFVTSFPVYGVSTYISGAVSPSYGLVLANIPYLLILLFYGLDLLYKQEIYVRVNRFYYLVLALLVLYSASLFVAVAKNLPDFTIHMAILRTALLLGTFHSFIVVYLYNSKKSIVPELVFKGLSLLLIINIIGFYVLGLSNNTHSIEGRMNLPFIGSLYSGASLLAIINLMLLFYLKVNWRNPITFSFLLVYFLTNLFFLYRINSRVVSAIFVLVLLLMVLSARKRFTGVFLASLWTLPFLLSSGVLIYKILTIPVFAAIMRRVDFGDITTFNGRSFIWQSGVDWLLFDQRGLIFGNGYKGHYYVDLLYDVGKLFDLEGIHNLHMHSGSMEILVSHGIVGLVLFILLLYSLFKYYRKKYAMLDYEGVYFPVVVFLLFVTHIDTFVYMDNLGGFICALLMAGVCVKSKMPAEAPGVVVAFTDQEKSIMVPFNSKIV